MTVLISIVASDAAAATAEPVAEAETTPSVNEATTATPPPPPTTQPEQEGRRKSASRPPPPPPVGVRYGEPLENERFRVRYFFDREQRQGLMVGDRDISPENVLSDPNHMYDRTPRSLEVTIHTFQLAYALHPRATFIVEVPFLQKELETMDAFGVRTEEQTRGIGDIGFALVVPFIKKGSESSHFHLGFNAPTGSIRRGGDNSRLPFDSQIGNGTFNFEWGWTYRGDVGWLSWGGQAVGWHPIGRNDLEYREGSRFDASVWSAVQLPAGLSASLRLSWQKQNNTRVAEDDFVAADLVNPSDNPKARGGTRLSVTPGLAFDFPHLMNQRISIEVGIPVHQDLDGPQLAQDWTFRAGWQWGF